MKVIKQVRDIVICDCGGFIVPEINESNVIGYYCIECRRFYSPEEYREFSKNNLGGE